MGVGLGYEFQPSLMHVVIEVMYSIVILEG